MMRDGYERTLAHWIGSNWRCEVVEEVIIADMADGEREMPGRISASGELLLERDGLTLDDMMAAQDAGRYAPGLNGQIIITSMEPLRNGKALCEFVGMGEVKADTTRADVYDVTTDRWVDWQHKLNAA